MLWLWLFIIALAMGCMALAAEYRAGRSVSDQSIRPAPMRRIYEAEALLLFALITSFAAGALLAFSIGST